MKSHKDPCPESEIRFVPNLLAVLIFVFSVGLFSTYVDDSRTFMESVRSVLHINASSDVLIALSIMFVTAVPMLIDDLRGLFRRIESRSDLDKTIDWYLVSIKLMGIWGTLIFIGVVYWALPEYGSWYQRFWDLLWLVLPVFFFLSPVYVIFCSRYQNDEKDSYYHAGLALLGLIWRSCWEGCESAYLYEHLRQWLIKAFFLPLMVIFLFDNVTAFLNFDYSSISEGFKFVFDYAHLLLYSVDVIFAAIGYFFTFKLLNTDIRSAEPSLLGWFVCLLCYPPFWNGLIGEVYLKYDNGFYWGQWLGDTPIIYTLWGSAILLLIAIYSIATVSLGYRFSNLTYRGLATSGVYRWTKHPAYIAKNMSWWLVSIPFISQDEGLGAVRACLLLLAVNYIYYLRAKTEERHLSQYSEYVEYANWINRHGIFRWMGQLIPALRYDEAVLLKQAVPAWWKRLKEDRH